MIINDEDMDLEEEFNLKNNKKINELEVILRGIKRFKDYSFMFSDCTNIISITIIK